TFVICLVKIVESKERENGESIYPLWHGNTRTRMW
ncbi:MAG: hypothetical protein ACI85U_003853, partial [Candidatus Promineifilaceae bacterium]